MEKNVGRERETPTDGQPGKYQRWRFKQQVDRNSEQVNSSVYYTTGPPQRSPNQRTGRLSNRALWQGDRRRSTILTSPAVNGISGERVAQPAPASAPTTTPTVPQRRLPAVGQRLAPTVHQRGALVGARVEKARHLLGFRSGWA